MSKRTAEEKKLYKDIIQWDIQTWSKALDFWECQTNWKGVQTALEIGANKGGLSLWLSLKGISTICSDVENTEMQASALHSTYPSKSIITYNDIDATNIPYENYFDIIVFKSILGGIGRINPDQQKIVIQQIYKALKPGGQLLFAENTIASPFHRWLRKAFVPWGDTWRYMSADEIKEAMQAFSLLKIKSTGVLATLGRNENQRRFLSIVDRLFFNRITPASWKYLCYGVAMK